jgi:hypothetical protein
MNSNNAAFQNINTTIMKRKTFPYFLLSLLAAGFCCQAQPEAPVTSSSIFYIKAYAGYGLITPGGSRFYTEAPANGPNAPTTFSLSKGLGYGLRYGGGLGVVLSDFLNAGIDVEFVPSSTISASSTGNNGTDQFTYTQSATYSALSLTPNVIFKALSKPSYYIYNRIGIILNLPSNLTQQSNDTITYATGTAYRYQTVSKFKIGLNPGLNVAVGIQFKITENLRGFGEIFANYLAMLPKTAVQTSLYETNQTNPSPSKTGTYYLDNITYVTKGSLAAETNTTLPGYPTTTPDGYTISNGYQYSIQEVAAAAVFRMNNIGINIGLAFRF